MGKAGQALKQVLETYDISQNRLAVMMGTRRGNVHRWVNEMADPSADAVLEIRDGLEKINSDAAEEFIRLYLSKSTQND
ncbi:MAG: helix-turn-helix domain-containing protein [Symplocastrum torsivum CPER-KK1]|jgi:transcriptional regulator with XRE-family HTH domain|uniref:Helix-turn-helix domain-containing protein n=1 Tax=Symplocastrum torsivum CPER-KK1 TaxID=450513 RepID=A0A951PRF9_9CYAN|nr:helix-turn-helix domain-containing protein [Symplocastrum torsivum CPER-KK1]